MSIGPLFDSDAKNIAELVSSQVFPTIIEPVSISSNQDDYSPAGFEPGVRVKQDSSSNVDIKGVSSIGFVDGDTFGWTNISNKAHTFRKDSGSSLPGNRLLIKNNISIGKGFGVIFLFDATASPSAGWRVLTEVD